MSDRQPTRVSPAKLALAVRQLRAGQPNLDLIASDPIAIVGMGCRFPGGGISPDAFWQALHAGRDCVTEIPAGRWKDAGQLDPGLRRGAYFEEIDGFDAAFFGISPREAQSMDPQQRLLLEVVWESLWDAGMEPRTLSGTGAGVFAAIYNTDYARMFFRDRDVLTAQGGIGTAHSVAAGRLSYLLNISGPSLAIDSACSSSLVAIHLACQSLRAQECTMAIAAASSLKILSDEVRVFSKWGMLSSDGRCKTFDAAADGFVPGEGAGALVLKRLSDAIEHGDRIHAVIRGTAVNHDGRTTVLTAPNGLAQQQVLRAALKNAMIAPQEVGYIETHGTGTSLGDPIEMEAIAAVYGEPLDSSGSPLPHCQLGAVKTNLGHLEAAAGMAGMIKVILSLQHGEIPGNLHFSKLNPVISLEGTRLQVAAKNISWPRAGTPRVAGVSSFGLGGTNAHIVVEEAPVLPAREGRTIPLPARPWQRQRFWMQESSATVSATSGSSSVDSSNSNAATPALPPNAHPLLGPRVESPFVSGVLYSGTLNPATAPWLAEHGLDSHALVPFAAWLELAAAAAANQSDTVALLQFTVREPLFLPPSGCPVQAHVVGDSVEIASAQGPEWRKNASATIGSVLDPQAHLNPWELQQRCSQRISPDAVYHALERTGLRYGPSFRPLQQVWRASRECIAHLRLDENLQVGADRYRLHPALLDGCLQTVLAARENSGEELFLPIGVDRFDFLRPGTQELWVHTVIVEETAEAMVANIRIADAQGEIIARLTGFTARRTSLAAIREKIDSEAEDGLDYTWAWRKTQPAPQRESLAGEHWLLVESGAADCAALSQSLTAKGAACTVVPAAELDRKRLDAAPWTGIVYDARGANNQTVPGLPWAQKEKPGIVFALELSRALSAGRGVAPRLVVLCTDALAVRPSQDVSLEGAPLFGMLRTMALEFPETNPRWIDIGQGGTSPGRDAAEPETSLAEEIVALDQDPIIAYRAGQRYAARLVRQQQTDPSPQKLTFSPSGRLEEIRLEPSTRAEPCPGEIEIAVEASGLNFRDVLTAMGMLTARASIPGAECAGTVVRVGRSVQGFQPGDAVLAFVPSSLQSFVRVPADFAVHKPAKMTFVQAAGIPVAFLTALYGLDRLAKLSSGQTVLVHAAAGGLGMAAMQLAVRAGAEVYATAGTEEKRALVQRLGAKHVFDSRSLGFREAVLQATGGRGVDVVLNSLAGDFLRASFDVVAHGGTFLEAGKRDIWSAEQVAALGRDIRYFPFDLGDVAMESPAVIAAMLRELMQRFESGELNPLPAVLYPLAEATDAFRTMAQARHTGKIVLAVGDGNVPSPWKEMLRDGSVLLTGGLGALALETAQWLAAQGARSLVLAGRNVAAAAGNPAIAELRRSGVQVAVERCDVADTEQVRTLLARIRATLPPLCAVFHAAGVTRDAVLANETWDTYGETVAAKIDGAWNLHCLTEEDPVRLMVFYSSAASLLGSPGQGSYAAANAFLDALAHFRAARGLRTLSVNWGAWAAAGMAARLSPELAARWSRLGARPMLAARALASLDQAITSGSVQTAILDMDWASFAASRAGHADRALFRELLDRSSRIDHHPRSSSFPPSNRPSATDPASPDIVASLRSTAPAERPRLLREYLKDCARKTLGLDPKAVLAEDVPLQEVGLDSLMALEMRNDLAQSLHIALPAGLLFDYPAIAQLAQELLRVLAAEAEAQPPREEPHSEQNNALDSLSEEEAEQLLMEELDRPVPEKANV